MAAFRSAVRASDDLETCPGYVVLTAFGTLANGKVTSLVEASCKQMMLVCIKSGDL